MEVKKIPKKTVTLIEPKRSVLVDKEKYHQKRVAAYCRVSTDSEEQLTSYVNQKKFYTDMIARNTEWEFAGLYADEGISGTRADKRPEFNNMIKACLAGKIDYIITKSVARFARNTVDALKYVRKLKTLGIGVYFEEQCLDSLKSESELALGIYSVLAQAEHRYAEKRQRTVPRHICGLRPVRIREHQQEHHMELPKKLRGRQAHLHVQETAGLQKGRRWRTRNRP